MNIIRMGAAVTLAGPLALLAAAQSTATTIDFEGFEDRAYLKNEYSGLGLTFAKTVQILKSPNYNFQGFPPHSGENVLFVDDPVVTVLFSFDVISVSAYASTDEDLNVYAYDISGKQLGSLLLTSNYGGTSLIGLTVPGIRSVSFATANGGATTLDDISFFRAGAVPEPATWALMIFGMGAIGGAMRRRHAITAKVRFA